jgi:acetolactate synthase-1/2/3 large subunit
VAIPAVDDPLTGAHLLVRALESRGARQIWAFPGDTPRFAGALPGRDIDFLPARQPHAVTFIAEALGRRPPQPAVVYASLSLNAPMVAALLVGAHLAEASVLLLLDPGGTTDLGLDATPDPELVTCLRPFLRRVTAPIRPWEIPPALVDAYEATVHGRPGAAVLILHEPVLVRRAPHDLAARALNRAVVECGPGADDVHVDLVHAALLASRTPIVIAGEEIVRRQAEGALRAFVERHRLPVLTTIGAKGVLPEDHAQSLGTYDARHDSPYGEALQAFDLFLFVGGGAEPPPGPGTRNPRQRVVTVGGWRHEYADMLKADLHVVGDVVAFLVGMTVRQSGPRPPPPDPTELRRRVREGLRSRSRESAALCRLLDVMRLVLDAEDVVVCDVGPHAEATSVYYPALAPRTVLFSTTGALGYAIPAAIGVKSREPGRSVVAVCGVAGLMLAIQELETSIRSYLPITVVVLESLSSAVLGETTRETMTLSSDVLSLASSFGTVGVPARTLSDFERVFREARQSPLTTVITITLRDLVASGA